MTLRPNSIVYELIYDDKQRRATGVRVIDTKTNEHLEFNAKVIFLCASTFASTHIMLNSVSPRFPNGFGNDSGELGCNIMDNHLHVGATAVEEGFQDRYYFGNRPNDAYVPRYRNLGGEKRDYVRGFGYQGNASRLGWPRLLLDSPFGAAVKTEAAKPGPWYVKLDGFGEILPNHANRVTLDKTRKDKWGLPLLSFDAVLRDNEFKMRKDMKNDAAEMLAAAGFKDVKTYDREIGIGLGIHEMGTARMGKDPKTSVLNKWNQVHACTNVYVTDGSFMASSACQNPSLTYMAFTARAVDHAVGELKRGNV